LISRHVIELEKAQTAVTS